MYRFNTGTGVTTIPLKISSGTYSNLGNNTSTLIGLSTENSTWSKCAIGHCRTGPYDVGAIVFLCNGAAGDANVSMSDEKMRISADGNVGIGTNPVYKCHVKCTYDVIASGLHLDAGDTGPNQYALTIYPYVPGSGQVGWKFRTQSQTGGTQTPLTFDHAGNVGISTNPSEHKFTVLGTIAATQDVIAYYSDERLKDITEYVSNVLPTLSKIRVFKYNCNDLAVSYGFDKSKNEIGVSAQDIQTYYPELVTLAPFDTIRDKETGKNISKSRKDYLTLNYERLVPILLQGIKELKEENNIQQKEINDLKQKTNMQEKEIDDLKLRLNRLELLL